MTGPEHYRQAEKLLAKVHVTGGIHFGLDGADYVAAAQVHATLALAAATLPVCSCPAGMRYHAQNCLTDPGQLMNPGAAQ